MTLFTRTATGTLLVGVLLVHGASVSADQAATAKPAPATAPVVASGRVELADPVGDIQPIVYLESVGDGTREGGQVSRLRRREARHLE